MDDRRAIRAWCLYDWANSAFACTVMAALYPPFFRAIAEADGLAAAAVTARWGLVTGLALLASALLSPVLGAVADVTGAKKKLMALFMAFGTVATAAFAALPDRGWPLAGFVFAVASLGFTGSIVFYESLLPHVASARNLHAVSTRAYAWGYLGGGLLLIVNMLWVTMPGTFGLPSVATAVRLSFVSVAVWWSVFSLPFWRRVPEPAAAARVAGDLIWRRSFAQMRDTWRDLRGYRPLLIMLAAYWLYNDGIGTIIKMATSYGGELGIGTPQMIQALVLTQLIGVPCTLLCGRLAERAGARPVLMGGLSVYAAICVLGYFMTVAWQFFLLAALVGTVQGGTQALSRSLFGSMVPRHKSAEFFGFYAMSGKFAGIAGPLLFALVSQLAGASRLSVLFLLVFFASGAWLLSRVDLAAGRAQALAVEARDRRAQPEPAPDVTANQPRRPR
ncbi:MAG: MFS transporter [Candidatus Krumholzibacteria bacterium]|nr:MFS transporter [Candidatus Krumholzibacteria bacterium]